MQEIQVTSWYSYSTSTVLSRRSGACRRRFEFAKLSGRRRRRGKRSGERRRMALGGRARWISDNSDSLAVCTRRELCTRLRHRCG